MKLLAWLAKITYFYFSVSINHKQPVLLGNTVTISDHGANTLQKALSPHSDRLQTLNLYYLGTGVIQKYYQLNSWLRVWHRNLLHVL